MTGYALDSTASAWPPQVKFTLPGHPSVRVVLSITCVPSFVMIVGSGLSDDV